MGRAQLGLGAGTPVFWGPCRRGLPPVQGLVFSMVMTTADVLGTEGVQWCVGCSVSLVISSFSWDGGGLDPQLTWPGRVG